VLNNERPFSASRKLHVWVNTEERRLDRDVRCIDRATQYTAKLRQHYWRLRYNNSRVLNAISMDVLNVRLDKQD